VVIAPLADIALIGVIFFGLLGSQSGPAGRAARGRAPGAGPGRRPAA
jgi:hypothetical protein